MILNATQSVFLFDRDNGTLIPIQGLEVLVYNPEGNLEIENEVFTSLGVLRDSGGIQNYVFWYRLVPPKTV